MEYKDTEHTGNKGNTRKTGFKGKKEYRKYKIYWKYSRCVLDIFTNNENKINYAIDTHKLQMYSCIYILIQYAYIYTLHSLISTFIYPKYIYIYIFSTFVGTLEHLLQKKRRISFQKLYYNNNNHKNL